MDELSKCLEDITMFQSGKTQEEWDRRNKYSGGDCPACGFEFKTSSTVGYLYCSGCSLSVEEKDIRGLQHKIEINERLVKAIKYFFKRQSHYVNAITDRDFISDGAEVQRLIMEIAEGQKEKRDE